MLEFSVTPVLDGLIHLLFFFLKCAGLYFLVKILTRGRFERAFHRTVVLVVSVSVALYYVEPFFAGRFPESRQLWTTVALLGIVLLMSRKLLKTGWLVTAVVGVVLVPATLLLHDAVPKWSAVILPEGATFMEYAGLSREEMEASKARDLKETNIDVREIVRVGLDAVASLTEEEELTAMKNDFSHGVELFAERKAWMDSLSPEERQAYREEMAMFLAEQGLAADRYSLAAIQKANPTNLTALASLFAEMKAEAPQNPTQPIRSISESLAAITENLTGFELSDKDQATLQRISLLMASDDGMAALAEARDAVESTQGSNALMGTVLAAVLQAESGLPTDALLADDFGKGMFNVASLETLSPRPKDRADDGPSFSASPQEELSELAVREATEVSMIPITVHLGVVRVPSDELMGEWIEVVQQLRIKGFASLGEETVILLENGAMHRNGDTLQLVDGEYAYNFSIDHIQQGRVLLSATERTEN